MEGECFGSTQQKGFALYTAKNIYSSNEMDNVANELHIVYICDITFLAHFRNK